MKSVKRPLPYNKKEETIPSCNGKDNLGFYLYSPIQKPKAVLHIVHGMCAIRISIEKTIETLTQGDILVCGSDHLGHGKHAPKQGYFGKGGSYSQLVEDVAATIKKVKQWYPNLPYFILGHSMGSLVVRQLMSRSLEGISGIILMGTAGPNWKTPFGLRAVRSEEKKRGEDYVSEKLYRMIFGGYNRKWLYKRTDSDWLSRDGSAVNRYLQDEYCNFHFTVQGYRELLLLQKEVNQKKWYQSVPKDIPILLLSGSMDPVGAYGKGVQKVYQKLKDAGVSQIQMKLYDGARHELLHETNRQEVQEDMMEWILAHI